MDESIATSRRLYRSRQDRMVAGVAGGLSHYLNVDPVLIRLAFVILTLTTGMGLIAYVILAIVVPLRPVGEEEPVITSSIDTRRGRELAGYALLGLGLLALAANFGLFRIFDWGRFWPVFLVAAGVLLLLNHWRGERGIGE